MSCAPPCKCSFCLLPYTLALYNFLYKSWDFNSLAEPFSESQISLGLKISNWMGCQVIAGLQKLRMLTGKALSSAQGLAGPGDLRGSSLPWVRQPCTPCLSLWLHCESLFWVKCNLHSFVLVPLIMISKHSLHIAPHYLDSQEEFGLMRWSVSWCYNPGIFKAVSWI